MGSNYFVLFFLYHCSQNRWRKTSWGNCHVHEQKIPTCTGPAWWIMAHSLSQRGGLCPSSGKIIGWWTRWTTNPKIWSVKQACLELLPLVMVCATQRRYITRLRMHDLRNKNYSVNSLRYYVSEGDGVLRCDWLTQGLFCLKVCLRLTGVVEIRRI